MKLCVKANLRKAEGTPTALTPTQRKSIRQRLGANRQFSIGRDGVVTVKHGYYYRHGMSADLFARSIQKVIPEAVILDQGDHWAAWPKDSYFWVKFKLPEATTKNIEPEVPVEVAPLVAKLKMISAKQPTPPSPELVAAIENRKQHPTDFEAFKQLFEAVRNDNEAVSGYDGVGTIMRRLGIMDSDIHALMSAGEQTTPEGKFVRDHWDEVNSQYNEKKDQDRLTKFGPELVALCKQVYAYANKPENYENGWDVISESWDLEELADEIKECKTLRQALDRVRPYVKMEG